jgi:hypothetical protein
MPLRRPLSANPIDAAIARPIVLVRENSKAEALTLVRVRAS